MNKNILKKEQILRKIEILKEDLLMQIEGSVMSDSINIEIEFLKKELEKIED
jgi:hypothetical protein